MRKNADKSAVFQAEEGNVMKEMSLSSSAIYEEENQTSSVAASSRKLWILAAIVSSLGGMTIGLAGLFYILLASLEPTQLHHRIGGWLMIVVLPLFVLAAHTLDKIDEAKKAEKLVKYKYWRKNGTRFQNFK